MKCFFDHDWGWPRKRGDRHMQVCLNCGAERESKVRFDGPRYRRTQEPSADFSAALPVESSRLRDFAAAM